jgi:selenocysteine-specific elongation factor
MADERAAPVHVVATAGHVDHGKSSLLLGLTGMDPDRLEEEKRRGLTIDLGFAWCTLPSGAEVGFVDVPGHERFVRNMLAGVGPVRLVLFVVAADEGWKPQSEEHLQILDVLGVDAGVIALTKTDLVDDEALAIALDDVRGRVAGTALERARVVPCSSATGAGLQDLSEALDEMLESAPRPREPGPARLHVDRVFAIAGAGTVVTGTLTGGALSVGDEVALLPRDLRARIRGLQTHRRRIARATPGSRVAVNLVGPERSRIERGDVLVPAGRWRPTSVFEMSLSPVRGLSHDLSARGAYKLHAGAAERDARVRIYGGGRASPGERSYARVRVDVPLVLRIGDRVVVRDAGRDETVAGGTVLDADPPRRAGPDPERRLAARERASTAELPALVIGERGGAIEADELEAIVGHEVPAIDGATRRGAWWLGADVLERATRAGAGAARDHHAANPLEPGAPAADVKRAIASAVGRPLHPALDALLDAVVAGGGLVADGPVLRLPEHRPDVARRAPELDSVRRVVEAGEPTPPTIGRLVAAGHPRDVVDAAIRTGVVVRIAPDLVVTAGFLERALAEIRSAGAEGLTVSALRERLGTSRKYAVPLVEHLDARGLTIRRGDVRIARRADG